MEMKSCQDLNWAGGDLIFFRATLNSNNMERILPTYSPTSQKGFSVCGHIGIFSQDFSRNLFF